MCTKASSEDKSFYNPHEVEDGVWELEVDEYARFLHKTPRFVCSG